MSGSSPPPRYEVAYFDAGRGEKWYVVSGSRIRGGPFGSREEAEAEVERRYEEMQEFYEAVEADARAKGYTVCW